MYVCVRVCERVCVRVCVSPMCLWVINMYTQACMCAKHAHTRFARVCVCVEMSDLLLTFPLYVDFLHVTDIFQLSQTCVKFKRVEFTCLEVHSFESTDSFEDGFFGDYLTSGAPIDALLNAHYSSRCERVCVYNRESVFSIRKNILEKLNHLLFLKVKRFNFNLGDWNSDVLVTLCLGFDSMYCLGSGPELHLMKLKLPNLKTLDLTGFPISEDSCADMFGDCSPFVCWLMSLLSSVKSLHWFRLNCSVYEVKVEECLAKAMLFEEISNLKWNNSLVFFYELTFNGCFPLVEESFTDFMFCHSTREKYDQLHTVTLRSSECVLKSLTECFHLYHLVLTNFGPNWDLFSKMLTQNSQSLQVLVLKVLKCEFHIDTFLHLLLSARVDNLDRFELEVVMDEQLGKMAIPQMTLCACVAFRCRYMYNTFFKKTRYGIYMAERRNMCTSTVLAPACATPVELFANEMIRHMFDEEIGEAKFEAEMYTAWNTLTQQQRATYVEVFDEFIDVEFRQHQSNNSSIPDCSSGKTKIGYCDLAATMANLRE